MVIDEWGRDPNVRIMRGVFRAMEDAQKTILDELGIPPFDPRLRRWREIALGLWERCWGRMHQSGIPGDGERAAGMYLHCLSRVMGREGVDIPEEMLPDDKEVKRVLMEVLP